MKKVFFINKEIYESSDFWKNEVASGLVKVYEPLPIPKPDFIYEGIK